MTSLSATLAFLLVAASPPRPCTPVKANAQVRVSFLADADLAALAKWAKESTCVDYGFEASLASRRLAQGVILTVNGRDVESILEILLHTMNLRSYNRGAKRWIVPDGPETAQSREVNERARADVERDKTLANIDGEIKRQDDSHYAISRKGADAIMASLPGIARSLRISPELKGGKQIGFRLTSVKPGTLLTRIGLQNGDVVTSLNGHELTSPDRAVEAYTKFRTSGLLRAGYLRNGKALSVEIKVE
jgi:type II secretory pathway component PulC